jgi:transcriptional regulator with XRE-family HTH domain
MPSFSDRLKELRKRDNITQKALAEIIRVSWRAIQSYELGTATNPTSDILIKLADYFNVSVDYLLGRVDYLVGANGCITVPSAVNEEAKK